MMNLYKRLKLKNGSALVLVMFAVTMLVTIGMGLLMLGFNSRMMAVKSASETAARCAADAGVAKALYQMNQKLKIKPWDGSGLPQAANETLPNCDATFSYTVTGNVVDGYIVESAGGAGRMQKTITTALPLTGPFEYAIFSNGSIELKNSAVVDWYNYDADDGNMKVGTNSKSSGAVALYASTTINGDVIVGVGGDPAEVIDMGTGATITGSTCDMTEKTPLPSIIVPVNLQSLPSSGKLSGDATITSDAKYNEIDLKNNKKVVINGAVSIYVVGNVTLGNSAEVQIVKTNPNASLTLYVGGNIEQKTGSNFNNESEQPKKLKIYGLDSCGSINLKNSSNLYGAIYAPQADIKMFNSGAFYGSVVGKKFGQDNSSPFHYDASLRDTGVNDEATRFVMRHWKEQ